MIGRLQAADIFQPGTFPVYTYVSRQSEGLISYEQRLEEAMETPGFLTSIVGPSKSGKTVLCEKVLPQDRMISFTGMDFRQEDDFWTVVARKLGLPVETELSETKGGELQGSVQASAGVNILVKKGAVSGGGSYKTTSSETMKSRQIASKDRVVQEFLTRDLVMLLDDFHYINKDVQIQIAYQLKDAIRQGLKAIVISLPHRADDAIRGNPDLNGRMNFINIEPWTEEELVQIPITGFKQLDVDISHGYSQRLACESITSPQLMQNICLNLARILNVDNTRGTRVHSEEELIQAFRRTTLNMAYKDVIKVIEAGPPTRGQKRTAYAIAGTNMDVYGAILYAIAKDPPIVSISIEELRQRIDSVVAQGRVERSRVLDALRQMQTIIHENGPLYQVFEWKDGIIHILDPYFLFYLRWSV